MTLKKLKNELARFFGNFFSALLLWSEVDRTDDDAMSLCRLFRYDGSDELGEGERSDKAGVEGTVDARLQEKVDETGLMASTLTTESGSLPNLALYCSLGIQGTTGSECMLSDCIMQPIDDSFPTSYLIGR